MNAKLSLPKEKIEEFCLRWKIAEFSLRHVSKSFQDRHSDIPWKNIIAQRNVLAHEYEEIKQELIWKVATVRIPDYFTLIFKVETATPRFELMADTLIWFIPATSGR